MEKKQIIVCFENGKWLTDFLQVPEGQDIHGALEKYQECYEAVRECNMPIIARLLPAIIQISIMGK